MGRRVTRWLAVLSMLTPTARVLARSARRRRRRLDISADVDGRRVVVPHRRGDVLVDGRAVGPADVRHDVGTSTLEAWTQIEPEHAGIVVRAVEQHADRLAVRRVAWLVEPGTPEASVVAHDGFELESETSAPIGRAEVRHELWVKVRA